MLCQKLIEQLELHSPPACAEEWDNVGLLAGRRDKEVHKVLLALDATDSVIEQAVQAETDLLLTHHPLLFSPVRSVTTDDMIGRRLVRLIQNDISYYAMHTNFDVRGMAELTKQRLELLDAKVLELTNCLADGTKEGIGRVGRLSKAMTLRELAEFVKQQFQLDFVRICGDKSAVVERVAVAGGSGKSMVHAALEADADVFISGDLDHHTVIDAMSQGLLLIDAGHYGTEKIFVPYMEQYLKENFADLEIRMAVEQNPFSVV